VTDICNTVLCEVEPIYIIYCYGLVSGAISEGCMVHCLAGKRIGSEVIEQYGRKIKPDINSENIFNGCSEVH